MPKKKPQEPKQDDILFKFFKINNEIVLNSEEKEYLNDLREELREIIQEEGEVGSVKIKEIILDDLLKNDYDNIINYLGLEIDEAIKTNIDQSPNS